MTIYDNDQIFVYAKKADFNAIALKYGIDKVTARIMRNRDLVTDEEIGFFLHGGINDLHNPLLLPDMEKAVGIIFDSVKNGEHIRIVGDYDIDGVCATYILKKGLDIIKQKTGLSFVTDYVIPDRIKDGYGINIKIVSEAIKDKADVILTCDNGISAFDELKEATASGIKVVVTDHHNLRTDENGGDIFPDALAIVNSKRSDSKYPEKEICGAVTAWKLITALFERFGIEKDYAESFIDFAAIATVGDIMNLCGENRVIVKEGLKALNRSEKNTGLNALIRCLGLEDRKIDVYQIGFIIGPCINAAGRLETAESALSLFFCEDEKEAVQKAMHLINLNESRKTLTERGAREAFSQAENNLINDSILVIYIEDLHESLAGIVAGRVKEAYNKPVFVMTSSQEDKDLIKGSGRSTEGWDMFEGLQKISDILLRYGGHKMAAGITIKRSDFELLRQRLNENAAAEGLLEKPSRKIWVDVPVPCSYISEKFIKDLSVLEPFGPGNEKPLFADRNLTVTNMRVAGKNRNVLQIGFMNENGAFFNGVMFGDADALYKKISGMSKVTILYYPEMDDFRKNGSVKFNIEAVRETNG